MRISPTLLALLRYSTLYNRRCKCTDKCAMRIQTGGLSRFNYAIILILQKARRKYIQAFCYGKCLPWNRRSAYNFTFCSCSNYFGPSRFNSSKAVSRTKKDLPEKFLIREAYVKDVIYRRDIPDFACYDQNKWSSLCYVWSCKEILNIYSQEFVYKFFLYCYIHISEKHPGALKFTKNIIFKWYHCW